MDETEIRKTTEEKVKEISERLRPYITLLWKAKWKLLISNGIVFVFTILYLLFLTKPYFVSSVTILPEYGSKSTTFSQLGTLAAMAGVNVGEGVSTEIYMNLIKSESVLEPVIYSKYKTTAFPDSVDLIKYFGILNDNSLTPELQKRRSFLSAIGNMQSIIATDLERTTKILNISVTMDESKLSADVVNNIVKSLDQYIRTKRKNYASEQKYYLEKRVLQVKDSLIMNENKLKTFREQNRVVMQSPNLLLEQTRLMRSVEIMQTVYIELMKQLEIAKIDDIKNTPILNVKESAKDPIIKAGPKRKTKLIVILLLSCILSSAYCVFQENIKKYIRIIKGV